VFNTKPQAFLGLCLVLSTGASAAELDDDIPLDLAKALIEIPQVGEVHFYDQPPPSFPELTVPDDFLFVGSVDVPQIGHTRIVIKSQHSLDAGLEVLTNSLQEDGYAMMPRRPEQQRGFIGGDAEPRIRHLCSDDKGALSIRALNRGDEDNYYSIVGSRITVDTSGNSCGDRIRNRYEFINSTTQRMNSGIRAQFPIMTMPLEKDSVSRGLIVGSRGSGGDDYYETSSHLNSAWPPSYIHDHVVEQLVEQGWEQVQSISEQESNWRVTIDNQLLFGEFAVDQVGEDTLSLYFRISENDGLFIEDSGIRYAPNRI